MKKTDLTKVNKGKSHEENPLGGVPVGSNNTVEQGETIKNNFVYSDRIKLTKDLIGAYNLPKSYTNKTIADITKSIDNKFKDRNDKISLATKSKMLDNIAQVQEDIKSNMEPVNEPVQNQMFLGGEMTMLPGLDSGIQGITSLAMGDKNSALNSGIKTGTSIAGTAVGGPIGGMIGGAIGDITTGLINKGRLKRQQNRLEVENNILNNSKFTSDFALGGPLQPSTTPDLNYVPNLGNYTPTSLDPNYQNEQDLLVTENTLPTYDVQTPVDDLGNPYPKANLKPAVDWLGNNYGNIMRYAPVATNALQLANLKRPGYQSLNRLNNRYQPQYVDERSISNIANNELNNVSNSLVSSANGSQGALRANLLGASLNRGKTLSDAYINADAQNRQQDTIAQEFNTNIDRTNLQQANLELDINDRNSAAYENNKSKLLSQLGTDIGEIGKEEVYKKIARQMYGYTWDGIYWTKPDGTKVTNEEVKQQVDNEPSQKKLGGVLLNNKRK